PVRTRYVTETQSGAWPARVAITRSRTSTSVSSRGGMNSNEMLGRPRASMSEMRIAGSLPQDAGVSDATRHALGIQVLEQSERRAPARAHAIAQLRNRHRAGIRDQLPDERNSFLVRVFCECDVVADSHDVAALPKQADHFRTGTRFLHRFRQRRRSEGLPDEKLQQIRRRAAVRLQRDAVAG